MMNILFVDDAADVRLLAQACLKSIAHRLEFAESGREALEKIAKYEFDAVVTDLEMPSMTGYELASEIRHLEKREGRTRVRIISISGGTTEEHIQKSHRSGCDMHIAKPLKPSVLRHISLNGRVQPPPLLNEDIAKNLAALIPGFLERSAHELIILEKASKNRDFLEINRIAHRLEGTSGSFGFHRLSELGRELHAASRRSDDTETRRLIQQIGMLIATTIQSS